MNVALIAVAAVVIVLVLLLALSVRVAREYERGVIFRLGPAPLAAEGPRPLPAHPDHRQDGPRRPADGDAEHPAAGGDHEGQRARARERGRLLPDHRPGARDRAGRELHGRHLADRADDAAKRARPARPRRAPVGARQDQHDPPGDHRRGDVARGASRSRSSRSRTSRSRPGCSGRWRARPRPSASGAQR